MSVKRTKKTDGIFTFVETCVDLTKPRKGDMAVIREILYANTPQSRIQRLEIFTNAMDSTDPFVAMRLERLRDRIARASRAFAGGNGSAGLALIREAVALRREIEALPYTLKGLRFTGNKRQLSLLYRKAVEILEREGVGFSAKRVRQALEKDGVIRDDYGILHWTDDAGRQKKTPIKQFETNLSRHRIRIR